MNTNQDSVSEQLARWIAEIRYEDLPVAAVHHAKRCLLDFLGVTLAGSASGLARSVRLYLADTDCAGRALVIGTGLRLSPAAATLANGTAAAVLELDDGHARATIHPGATCIPALLAMAEARNATTRDILLAVAVAYEVSSRLGVLICNGSAARGFHCTPLVGVLGAAAGASKILGSDACAIANAFGIAGSNAGGLFDYHGGWLNAWAVNAGRAGREGLLSASLPHYGVGGPLDIFEGPNGFLNAFAGSVTDLGSLQHALGDEWIMLDTAVKVYPCCRRLHPVIDAVMELKKRSIDHDTVEQIVVETSAVSARLDRMAFDSVSAAQMSIPYGAAITLLSGEPTLESFGAAARGDARLRRLAEKVEVRVADDPAIADPGRFVARVSLTAAGETLQATIMAAKGDPANPISDELLEAKFRDLADPVLGSEMSKRIAADVWRFGYADEVLSIVAQLSPAA